MSIVRTSKRSGEFLVVARDAIEDTKLSWRAKGLHTFLMSKPDGWEIFAKHLVVASHDGRDAVYAALRELIDYGYAERYERREKGKIRGHEYVVFETPQLNPTQYHGPLTGLPYTVKPYAVNNSISRSHNSESSNNKERKAQDAYTFDQAWGAYPRRHGSNPKKAAEQVWNRRIKSGTSATDMYDGIIRYALFCEIEYGERFDAPIYMLKTFLGPQDLFKEPWDPTPRQPLRKNGKRPDDDDEASYAGEFIAYGRD